MSLISVVTRTIPRPLLIRLSYYVRGFLEFYYKGDRLEDPISGRQYRKFLPYGRINSRENALCPGSLSLERHRLLWLYLNQKTDFFVKKQRMLHIAPEQCFIDLFRKQANLDYTTADLFSPLADIKMDIHEIPFDENVFDVVFCNHVMEHVEDDHQCMKEVYRILKPGGFAIMQVPSNYDRDVTYEDKSITDPKEREKHFGQDDHLREYGRDYGMILQKAGFKVKEDHFLFDELKEADRIRFALPEKEIIYYCTK
jgi:SAM-dependent methyltransferase